MLYNRIFSDILNSQKLDPLSERFKILWESKKYLGFSYLRTENLSVNTIDCSTLTSQSYWLGAFLSIPFTAEGQRKGQTGLSINENELKPADIVVKYPSLDYSPDNTWNHVGLYLGEFKKQKYVIESNSKYGCIVSTLEDFNPDGGFKRYILNEGIRTTQRNFSKLRRLAANVPKLARLGAKQYSTSNNNIRYEHRGIDIYTSIGTEIRSPISGIISQTEQIIFGIKTFQIVSKKLNISIILKNIEIDKRLLGNTINYRTKIGKLFYHNDYSLVYDDKLFEGNHLHFEVIGDLKSEYELPCIVIDGQKFYNGLYLAKLNLIKSPV
ncbi:MAG: NlpC/P60 family protein [Saprospiraceae bacterium]